MKSFLIFFPFPLCPFDVTHEHQAGEPLFASAPVSVCRSALLLLASPTSGSSNAALCAPSPSAFHAGGLNHFHPSDHTSAPTQGWMLYRRCSVQFSSPCIFPAGVVMRYFGFWSARRRIPGFVPSGYASAVFRAERPDLPLLLVLSLLLLPLPLASGCMYVLWCSGSTADGITASQITASEYGVEARFLGILDVVGKVAVR